MKITIKVKKEFEVKYLKAKCGVRYWEDATVNGEEDKDGVCWYNIYHDRYAIAASSDYNKDWVISESALIDKLIELETEAQHGN